MNESTKKALLIALVVAAVAVAAFSGYSSLRGEQGRAGAYFGDPKGKPPKQLELEAAQAAEERARRGIPAPPPTDAGGRVESPGN
jgi:hypothetical protein